MANLSTSPWSVTLNPASVDERIETSLDVLGDLPFKRKSLRQASRRSGFADNMRETEKCIGSETFQSSKGLLQPVSKSPRPGLQNFRSKGRSSMPNRRGCLAQFKSSNSKSDLCAESLFRSTRSLLRPARREESKPRRSSQPAEPKGAELRSLTPPKKQRFSVPAKMPSGNFNIDIPLLKPVRRSKPAEPSIQTLEPVSLKPASKRKPNGVTDEANGKETIRLNPIPAGRVSLGRVSFSTGQEHEMVGVSLKPIPKRSSSLSDDMEGLSLKAVPKKSPSLLEDEEEVVSLRRISKRIPNPSEDKEGVSLKPAPKRTLNPSEDKTEEVTLKRIPKRIPRSSVDHEGVSLKPIRKGVLGPQEDQEDVSLKPFRKGSSSLSEEEDQSRLKLVGKGIPRPQDQAEGVALKPIPKRALSSSEDEERVSLKPIPKRSSGRSSKEDEKLSLKPIKKGVPSPQKEERVSLMLIQKREETEEAPAPNEERSGEESLASLPSVEPIEERSGEESFSSLCSEEPTQGGKRSATARVRGAKATKSSYNTVALNTGNVFMAFEIPDLETAPTDHHYQKLAVNTQAFYNDFLKKKFRDAFQSITVKKHKAYFGANKPSKEYNVYIEWDIQATFKDLPSAPSRHSFCQILVKDTNLTKYMRKYVKVCYGTPFRKADGHLSEQVNTELSD